MSKKIFFVSVLLLSVFLSGCQLRSKRDLLKNSGDGIEEKRGDKILFGEIVVRGNQYFLKTAAGNFQYLDSYDVDLSQYLGKTIGVKGQYSGDTLFVGEVMGNN